MSDLEQQIRRFVLGELQQMMGASPVLPGDPTDDFNLVTSGVLDSMEFVELIGRLEQEFELEVDFEGIDPGEFTTLGGLVRCVAHGEGIPRGGSGGREL